MAALTIFIRRILFSFLSLGPEEKKMIKHKIFIKFLTHQDCIHPVFSSAFHLSVSGTLNSLYRRAQLKGYPRWPVEEFN